MSFVPFLAALVGTRIVASGPDEETAAAPVTATSVAGTRGTAIPTTHEPKPTTVSRSARKASGTAPSAGRIKPGVSYDGMATFSDVGNGDGACPYGPRATP
ncbi:hypothetical protein ACW4TU_00805 [Streptomyces sp. QTS52]